MRSGHVDCLHSFGDLATTRSHAGRALEELDRHGCRLQVWVDHAVAPTNFGADIMMGSGDVPGAAAYHADLSCAYGIKYVWRGRVTSVVGQNATRSIGRIFTARHALQSARTLAKEAAKGVLGASGQSRYAMHASNALLKSVRLRSDHQATEFVRSNPHWGGVSCGDTAAGIAEVLTDRMLDQLVERQAVCVLYTHLGKVRSRDALFDLAGRAALDRLARRAAEGTLLVTTTRRLLGYCAASQALDCRMTITNQTALIEAHGPQPVASGDLQGITFDVPPQTTTAELSVNGSEPIELALNPPDAMGHPSASVPWTRLEYPQL
jgi:hypothetical protein